MDDQIEDHNIALVVFSDTTDLWWLKFLKSGFRHCFVIIKFSDLERDRWVALDPMLHHWQMGVQFNLTGTIKQYVVVIIVFVKLLH